MFDLQGFGALLLSGATVTIKLAVISLVIGMVLDLGSGRVDAMISDKLPALQWLKSASGSNYILKGDEIDINDNFAIAVRPGDELQARINKSLANLKANGTYDKINQQYFAVPVAVNKTADSTKTDTAITEPVVTAPVNDTLGTK